MHTQPHIWKRLGHAVASLAILLTGVGPLAVTPSVAHAAGTYVVDATLDAPDFSDNGVCDDGLGDCTLRAAIQEAANDVGPTTITFASDLAGQTFVLTSTFGTLLWPGSNITVTGGSRNITISGAQLSLGQSLFRISGDHNDLDSLTLRNSSQDGVQVGDFSGTGHGSHNLLRYLVIYSSGASGVYVAGSSSGGSQDNHVQQSTIGAPASRVCGSGNGFGVVVDTGATNTFVASNFIICNSGDGLQVNGASNSYAVGNAFGNVLGSARPNGGNGVHLKGSTGFQLGGNTIAGNTLDGVLLENETSVDAYSNMIGTDGTGMATIANGREGVEIIGNSFSNHIGDAAAGYGNVISGNQNSGVLLNGANVHNNTLVNNMIGTNISGTAALGNGLSGVRLQNDAYSNTIGGSGSVPNRNYIAGNGQDGVALFSNASLNYVEGNNIGVGINPHRAIPNRLGGVALFNAPNNSIGSSLGGTAQYISGNVLQGVYIVASDDTFIGQTNAIGLSPDGVSPLGNGQQGIYISNSSDTGVLAEVVAYNGATGILITGSGSTGNEIAVQTIGYNAGLPIDLGDDGPTANDPGDGDSGPDTLLNYPVITAAAGHVITGTACLSCTVFIYDAIGNPAAAGGGGDYLASVTANGAGQWHATLPGSRTRNSITLNACQLPCFFSGNSSELSPRPISYLPLAIR
jgi:hypothetical protein